MTALTINIEPMFEQLVHNAKNLLETYKSYRALKDLAEIIQYVEVSNDNIDAIENTLCNLDDHIDEIESSIHETGWTTKIILNLALTQVINIQHVLSNKASDFRLGNS
jgi:hypothetical protein